MFSLGRKNDEPNPSLAWSRDSRDRDETSERRSFFSLPLWGKKKKKDDDDDDDLPGPNATATLFPLLALRVHGIATA